MSDISMRGALPEKEKDLHCPLMGAGPKPNYWKASCQERLRENNCRLKTCPERKALKPKKEAKVAQKKIKRTCSVEGCDEPHLAKGLCKKHYWKKKTAERGKQEKKVDQCLECKEVKPFIGRGLCRACYGRFKRAGTLDDNYPVLRGKEAARAVMATQGKKQEPVEVPAESVVEETPVALEVNPEAAPEPQEEQLADPAPPIDPADGRVVLTFGERDQDLLSGLLEWAEDERRTLEQQILAVLDHANALAVDGRLPRAAS
jgi:hypothetical protein